MISVPYASFNWIRFYELAFASQPWRHQLVKPMHPNRYLTLASHSGNFKREDAAVAARKGVADFDGDGFARAWRAGYRQGMACVTVGEQSWVSIDVIYCERLDEILPQFGLPHRKQQYC